MSSVPSSVIVKIAYVGQITCWLSNCSVRKKRGNSSANRLPQPVRDFYQCKAHSWLDVGFADKHTECCRCFIHMFYILKLLTIRS